MKNALAIRHIAFEDLGSFATVLSEKNYHIRYLEAGYENLSTLDPLTDDLLIILGGPISVYEEKAYPFLNDEIRLLQTRLEAGRPVLGICLGAQLMAHALGAQIYPGVQKEMGWSPLILSDAGHQSPLAPFGDGTPVLHWHGDTFDLPRDSTLLASSTLYPHQAFSWGAQALALQFHIETTARGLERWFIGHACEIAQTTGVDVPLLRTETMEYAAEAEIRGQECLRTWLEQLY